MTSIPENVLAFIDRVSKIHAQAQEVQFYNDALDDIECLKIESPIEQMFWAALHAQCHANRVEINADPYVDSRGVMRPGYGIHISAQFRIEKYRVDFKISQSGIGPDEVLTPIIVELDGHAFHDKDKRQRAYEKARDRALVRAGYRVFHFTGSEVAADPFQVSYEALEALGLFAGNGYEGYDPSMPLGIEI
jgi:very-short-patch-repair endonuclease